jgi:hypothetical protein
MAINELSSLERIDSECRGKAYDENGVDASLVMLFCCYTCCMIILFYPSIFILKNYAFFIYAYC